MTAKGKETALTVIIPVSRINWLNVCIDSVQLAVQESKLETEVLLIDTRQNSSEDLQELTSNYSVEIKFHNLPGASYSEALDYSKNHINSQFVALMNDDDLVSKDRFLKQYKLIVSNDAEVCIGKFRRLGTMSFSFNLQPFKTFSYEMLFLGPYCANATWLLKTEFFKNLPSLNSKNWDWNIALMVLMSARVTYLPQVVYFYRQHDGQITRRPEYRLELFDSVYPQLEESLRLSYGFVTSSKVIKAIAFPYLPNDVGSKDLLQVLRIFWRLRKSFAKAPIWMTYHFLIRMAYFSKNYLKAKNVA